MSRIGHTREPRYGSALSGLQVPEEWRGLAGVDQVTGDLGKLEHRKARPVLIQDWDFEPSRDVPIGQGSGLHLV